MNKREVVRLVLDGKRPPYVPWNIGLTVEAREKLEHHFGLSNLEVTLQNHYLGLGNAIGFFDELDDHRVRDVFGVVWDRSIDKDIGDVQGEVLPEPTLKCYEFPNPLDVRFFEDIPETPLGEKPFTGGNWDAGAAGHPGEFINIFG